MSFTSVDVSHVEQADLVRSKTCWIWKEEEIYVYFKLRSEVLSLQSLSYCIMFTAANTKEKDAISRFLDCQTAPIHKSEDFIHI